MTEQAIEQEMEFEIIKYYPVERRYIILKPFEKGIMKKIKEIIFKKK